MQSFLNIVKSNIVAQAIISIVVGLLLMFWPGITIVTVLYLVGIVFAVMGISSLVSYFRAPEAERQVGVVFLFPQVIAGFFSVVLGIILVICGAVNAVRSGELKKYGERSWGFSMGLSVLIIIGGLVIIANPFETTSLFVFILGLIIAANGIVDLIVDAELRKAIKKA